MPEPKLNRETWGSWFEFVFSCIGSMVGLGNVWRFPYICFKNGGGIGYGMILMCVISASYYSTVISWTLFYFGNSFLSPLPWTSCNNTWNTQDCYMRSFSEEETMNSTVILSNITQFHNGSVHVEAYTSSEEFWENRVLGLTSSINNIGILRWELVLCSLGTWTVVILALIKGIKSSGKAIYAVCVNSPVRVLVDTANQRASSSWCSRRDAMILPFVDAFTSIFAGCVIFSTLGYTAAASNLDIDMVVKQGTSNEDLEILPTASFIAETFNGKNGKQSRKKCLFCEESHHQNTCKNVKDVEKRIEIVKRKKGGMYVLQLVDWYLSSIPRMFIMLLESIVIIYIYGVRRLSKDIEMMLGKQPSKIWKFFWLFVTPPLLTIIWVIMVIQLKTIKYGEIPYPSWSIAFGWILGMVPIFVILPPMIYTMWKQRGSFIQRLRKSVQPSYSWKAVVPNDFELQSAISK
ncbi:unnamed protein product [Mytilus edulis]|uniref:Uncharacterized protein n=1 Tax=Mytilus edulis TaxID=6550 RepID=A0A8S3QKF9_MYTED|nr:unnamed protein product [Mytilus edulis]